MTFKELIDELRKNPNFYGILDLLPDDLERNIRVKTNYEGVIFFEGDFIHFMDKLSKFSWKIVVPDKTHYLTVKYVLPITNDLSIDKLHKFFESEGAIIFNMTKQEINQ